MQTYRSFFCDRNGRRRDTERYTGIHWDTRVSRCIPVCLLRPPYHQVFLIYGKREALSYRRMMFSSLDVTVQDWLCSFWNEKSVFSLSSNNWRKNQQRFSTLARSNERPRSKLCQSVAAMSGGQRGGATKMTKSCVCCKSATGCGLVAVVCPEFENTCVFCVFGSAVVCPDFWQRKQLKQLNNFYNFLITYLHFLSYNLLITYF